MGRKGRRSTLRVCVCVYVGAPVGQVGSQGGCVPAAAVPGAAAAADVTGLACVSVHLKLLLFSVVSAAKKAILCAWWNGILC